MRNFFTTDPIIGRQKPLSVREFESRRDTLGNAWLSLADNPLVQAWIAFLEWLAAHGVKSPQATRDQIAQLSSIGSLYFCVPPNEKLIELWDTVDDRLLKIRHCQNIEGIRRELPFFEPPIDPELLIRARAAGLDLADVLADRFAPTPYQRFQVLLQTAKELCAEVRSLGAGLLSALERKEAEQLARLRSQQEVEMLRLVEQVRADQLKEAEAKLEALQKTRSNAVARLGFLQRQLGRSDLTLDASGVPVVEQGLIRQVQEAGASDDFRSLALVQAEIDQVWRMQKGHIASVVGGAFKLAASGARVTAAGLKAYPVTQLWADAVNYTGQALADLGDLAGLVATNASFWERRASLIAG